MMNITIKELLPLMDDNTLVGIKMHETTTIYHAKELRDVEKNEYTWWLFKSVKTIACVADEMMEPDEAYIEFTV